VQGKHVKSVHVYITSKTPTIKSCFKFSENNWLSRSC